MPQDLIERLTDTHGERILNAIRRAKDGATDFELAGSLDILLSSVNGARNTLMNRGLIEWSGERRPSGRGGMSKVWVAKTGA